MTVSQSLEPLSHEELASLEQDVRSSLRSSSGPEERLTRAERLRFEELFSQLSARLYRFAVKRCGSALGADDLTQEALLVILRRLPDLSQEVPLLPWSYGVVRTLCLKRQSRQRSLRGRSLELLNEVGDPLLGAGEAPDEHAVKQSDWEEVAKAIQTLEPLYREVLLLRDVEGLSAAETAQVVDASVEAVKSRLHRARSSLRVALTSSSPLPPLPKGGCPDIRRIFSEHLEGDLLPSMCADMERHLRSCVACARECEALKQTLSACSAPPATLPQELTAQLRAQLRGWLDSHPA